MGLLRIGGMMDRMGVVVGVDVEGRGSSVVGGNGIFDRVSRDWFIHSVYFPSYLLGGRRLSRRLATPAGSKCSISCSDGPLAINELDSSNSWLSWAGAVLACRRH